MVLPDLPKELYKAMEAHRKDLDLSQWQFYMLGIWAVTELDELVLKGTITRERLNEAIEIIKEKFSAPPEKTFYPRWKGKKI